MFFLYDYYLCRNLIELCSKYISFDMIQTRPTNMNRDPNILDQTSL